MALENFNLLSAASLFGVYIMMSSFASTLDIQQFISNLKQPKGLIIGIICQYIFLPFLSFLIASLFGDYLLPEQAVGLVIIGTMPGGILSNFFCFLFGADLTLSIAMTTASSLSSFIFIAINGLIYIPLIARDTSLRIDYISLVLSVIVLISGVLSGLYLSYKDAKNGTKCIKWTKKIIGWIAAVTLSVALVVVLIINFMSSTPIYKLHWAAWLAPFLLAVSAWFVAFGFAILLRLKRNSQVAVAIECANQNAGFATAIMILTLGESKALDIALGMPLLYSTYNYSLCLILGFVAKKSGYLTYDKDDKAASFGKLLREWRSKNTSVNDDKNEKIMDVETEMTQQQNTQEMMSSNTELSTEMDANHTMI
eukprot:65905_1